MSLSDESVRALYLRELEVTAAEIPTTSHDQHTMGSAVDAYALQRLPASLLDEVLLGGARIEVHGIHPDHMRVVRPAATVLDAGRDFGPAKIFNVVRPWCFVEPPTGGDPAATVIVAVPPGRDYLLHNASILRHYLAIRRLPEEVLRRVVRYPDAESMIEKWTGLADFVRPGSRVLMGYVNELVPQLLSAGGTVLEQLDNDHYGLTRLRLPSGQEVSALGVRFSFWGCISGRLAAECARLGAREVVYAGKLGTLTAPTDIYGRLFVPTGYIARGVETRLLPAAQAPQNGVLQRFPGLATGVHMSVGTVIEENLSERVVAESFHVETIDNEIAQMACAIADTGTGTAFSAVHFATDYLRRVGEPEHEGIMNLTNHRERVALLRKQKMIKEMGRVLRGYFSADSAHLTVRMVDAPVAAMTARR